MTYEDIVVDVVDGVATITINRPDNANKLRFQTARELLDALRIARETSDVDVVVLTGAGSKFFCIGGEHEELTSLDYSSVMPVIDLYEFIDTMPKPVIAAVNGYRRGRRKCPPRGVRPHGRRSARRLPPGRPDGGQLRRGIRHLVPGGDHRPHNGPRRCGT